MKQEDIEDLKQLIEFLKEHQVAEFEVDRDGLKVRLKFRQPEGSSTSLGDLARFVAAAPSAAPATGAPSAPVAEPAADPDAGLHLVKSPIVGTYYDSPKPGDPSFVKVGDHVEPGQVLCIIESMKLMNEIESEVAGTIAAKLMENGRPVEYGEALFAIRQQ